MGPLGAESAKPWPNGDVVLVRRHVDAVVFSLDVLHHRIQGLSALFTPFPGPLPGPDGFQLLRPADWPLARLIDFLQRYVDAANCFYFSSPSFTTSQLFASGCQAGCPLRQPTYRRSTTSAWPGSTVPASEMLTFRCFQHRS